MKKMTDQELTDLARNMAHWVRLAASSAASDRIAELYEDNEISQLPPSQQDELYRRYCGWISEHELGDLEQSLHSSLEYVIDTFGHEDVTEGKP